jgi:maltose O-acetyltransferase
MGIKGWAWKIFNAIQKSPIIHPKARNLLLRIAGARINRSAWLAEGVYVGSKNLIMGKETGVNVGSFLDGSSEIYIGDYVRCGPYVKILTGTHSYRHSVIRRRIEDGTISKPVKIERGCWIGMNSIILPGVKIAEGCIIAAGSVVIKDTKPNGLYAGNPAKRVKELPITDDV